MNTTLLSICVLTTLILYCKASCIQECVKVTANGLALNKLVSCKQSCIGQDTSKDIKLITTKVELFLDVESTPAMDLKELVDLLIVLGLEATPEADFIARTIVTEGAHTFPVHHAEAIIECLHPPMEDTKSFKQLVAKVIKAGASMAPHLAVSNIIVV